MTARDKAPSKQDDFAPAFFGNVSKPSFAPGAMVFHAVHGEGHVIKNDGGKLTVAWHGKGGTANGG